MGGLEGTFPFIESDSFYDKQVWTSENIFYSLLSKQGDKILIQALFLVYSMYILKCRLGESVLSDNVYSEGEKRTVF